MNGTVGCGAEEETESLHKNKENGKKSTKRTTGLKGHDFPISYTFNS